MADVLILLFLSSLIYGLITFGQEWKSEFHRSFTVDLSWSALPIYMFFSSVRASFAYILSLIFTLVIGYLAATYRLAEKIFIPMLDIFQSIPVLGFLPGLVLGLISVFPKTNVGLELSAILMIFTGQVWNMTFSFYSSLKSIPNELKEASAVMEMGFWQRFLHLELPYSAVDLAWNSLMSMAGGWFFLTVCEAFTLGSQEYRLPGLGSFMAEAIRQGNVSAMTGGVLGMIIIIMLMDFFIWRPVLVFVNRFRFEEKEDVKNEETLIQLILKNAKVFTWLKVLVIYLKTLLIHLIHKISQWQLVQLWFKEREEKLLTQKSSSPNRFFSHVRPRKIPLILLFTFVAFITLLMLIKFFQLLYYLYHIPWSIWNYAIKSLLYTSLRVFGSLFLGSLWAIPIGMWIGLSPARVRRAQPIIQVLASFPAPMLYPLVLGILFQWHIPFTIGSMFLMLIGVQWYILFNVLAGAMRIPQELKYTTLLMNFSKKKLWRVLYIPSVFPSLVTGLITGAGGAWNASIVAEYMAYKGQIVSTTGLGATISVAAAKADFQLLAAGLSVMVVAIVLLNRTLWAKIYYLAQNHFRMDV